MNFEKAKRISLVDYMNSLNFQVERHNSGLYWYRSPFTKEAGITFRVDGNKNKWYDIGLLQGGGIIKLGKMLYETDNISEVLFHIENRTPLNRRLVISNMDLFEDSIPFNKINVYPLYDDSLLSYLMSRNIHYSIAQRECVEVHYELYGRLYKSVGFRNDSGGYEIHNPYFKGYIGTKDCSQRIQNADGKTSGCCLFENFIDYLSFQTLGFMEKDKKTDDCIILNGCQELDRIQSYLDGYRSIHNYLGHNNYGKVSKEYFENLNQYKFVDMSNSFDGFRSLNAYLRNRMCIPT